MVPGVRGCIWTVLGEDAALALRIAGSLSRKRRVRDLEQAGSSEAEATELGAEILRVLAHKPMGTKDLSKALPEGLVRSLGPAGKKVGLSTTLPPSVRLLEFDGRVRRRPEGLRVEGERYDWEVAATDQRIGADASDDQAEQALAIGRRYFREVGPATLEEFALYTGFGKRVCRAAVQALELATVRIGELETEFFATPEQVEALTCAPSVPRADVHLLSCLDNFLTHRRDPGALLSDPGEHDRPVLTMGSRTISAARGSLVCHPPDRDRRRVGRFLGVGSRGQHAPLGNDEASGGRGSGRDRSPCTRDRDVHPRRAWRRGSDERNRRREVPFPSSRLCQRSRGNGALLTRIS